MKQIAALPLHRAYLIRAVEERLLRLFSEGKVTGTTHTCIGQELSAVALADGLDRQRDIIFSNHRCHGHYVAWTDDVEGLIAEVMGRRSGVCAGIGGSQHLCGERFFSNGVQGGIVPVSAGLAFAQKLAGTGGIVTACIGDGTLGEGVIYEAFNIAAKWALPLLVVLENNSYAQSTSQSETLAGDICARAAAFGWRTWHADTWEYDRLAGTMRDAVAYVRERCVPAFVRVDTYRLAAHSKGDDNRDAAEIAAFSARDPLNQFIAQRRPAGDPVIAAADARVTRAVELAAGQPSRELPALAEEPGTALQPAASPDTGTQLEAINRELHAWMAQDERVIAIGEDIRSPYGGAFKVTRGLSDAFPDRVLNTPISEAAIVGLGNGLALAGRRPVVEIMFGDFLALCFDQILNHAAKFHGMYDGKVETPIVVRSPMGGGRGYGPTHSQNLEKHFVGVPGLDTVVLHRRTNVARLYAQLRATTRPTLVIENKLLYRERADSPLPTGYRAYEGGGLYPTTVLRADDEKADLTLVAFGRMSVLAESALAQLAEEEIFVELVLPLRVSPLDTRLILESVSRTGKLLVIEEGTAGFDLGSEVIASATAGYRGQTRLHVRRVAALPQPIPSAPELEQKVLPAVANIVEASLELFDE